MTNREDRRQHLRSEVMASAMVLSRSGYAGSYLVENLSAGGALLVGDSRLSPGESLKVLLYLPGAEPIHLSGEVLRGQPSQGQEHLFAVVFQEVPDWAAKRIDQVVRTTLNQVHDLSRPAVLVVDDAPEVCRALERDLRALGRRSVLAYNPAEAIGRLEREGILIDTALVDLRLGDADGIELLQFLSEKMPDIRRILMSGAVRPCQLELALASGRAHAVLEKPWTRQTLAQVMSSGQPLEAPGGPVAAAL